MCLWVGDITTTRYKTIKGKEKPRFSILPQQNTFMWPKSERILPLQKWICFLVHISWVSSYSVLLLSGSGIGSRRLRAHFWCQFQTPGFLIWLTCCISGVLSYFSIAVIRYHDRDNLKKSLFRAYIFRVLSVTVIAGSIATEGRHGFGTVTENSHLETETWGREKGGAET